MSKLFEADTDGVIYMQCKNADRTAGALVEWLEPEEGVYQPSSQSWTRGISAQMSFDFNIAVAGEYQIFAFAETIGVDQWIWIDIDKQSKVTGFGNVGRLIYKNLNPWWSNGGGFAFRIFSAGRHNITIHSIHNNLKIKRFALVPTGNTSVVNEQTAYGPELDVVSGTIPNVQSETYFSWLRDVSRDDHRVLLLECTHSAGTKRYASQAFVSSQHNFYDPLLISSPYLEESVELNRVDLGDIEVGSYEDSENLAQLSFRGHTFKMLHGDVDWPIERFRTLSCNTIDSCQQTGIGRYRFDLVPITERYEKTFHTGADLVRVESIDEALVWLLGQFDGAQSYNYININPSSLHAGIHSQTPDTIIRYTVTEQTLISDVLTLICNSLDAFYRTTQTGDLEIVRIDRFYDPVITLDQNSILENRLSVSQTIPAVKRVIVEYDTGLEDLQRVTVDTGAETGAFDEEIIVTSCFTTASHATDLANMLARRYQNEQIIYEIDTLGVADVLVLGDLVSVAYENSINTIGAVYSIERSSTNNPTTIEVIV